LTYQIEKWLRSSQQMLLRTQAPLPVRIEGQPPTGGGRGNNIDAADDDVAVLVVMMVEIRRAVGREIDGVEATFVAKSRELGLRLVESVSAKEEGEVDWAEDCVEVVAGEELEDAEDDRVIGSEGLVADEGLIESVEGTRMKEDEEKL